MLKKVITIISLMVLSGCINTNTPIDSAKVELMKPERISISKRNKPVFKTKISTFEVLLELSAFDDPQSLLEDENSFIRSGIDIIKNNELQDPASSIGFELLKSLSKKYNIEIIESEKYVESNKVSDIIIAHPGVDWILDIETINWNFKPFSKPHRNRYRITYEAKLRLIDTRDKTIVAEGLCSNPSDLTGLSPGYIELVKNDAERLKYELDLATYNCIDMFKYDILKL